KGSIYLDDGVTMNYQQGEFFRMNFSCQADGGKITLAISPAEGKFSPWWTQIELLIYGIDSRPSQVLSGTAPVANWSYDDKARSITAAIPNSSSEMEITIR